MKQLFTKKNLLTYATELRRLFVAFLFAPLAAFAVYQTYLIFAVVAANKAVVAANKLHGFFERSLFTLFWIYVFYFFGLIILAPTVITLHVKGRLNAVSASITGMLFGMILGLLTPGALFIKLLSGSLIIYLLMGAASGWFLWALLIKDKPDDFEKSKISNTTPVKTLFKLLIGLLILSLALYFFWFSLRPFNLGGLIISAIFLGAVFLIFYIEKNKGKLTSSNVIFFHKIKRYLLCGIIFVASVPLVFSGTYVMLKQYYPPPGSELFTIDLSQGTADKTGLIFQVPRAYLEDGYSLSPLKFKSPVKEIPLFWMGFFPNGDPFFTIKGPKHTDEHIEVLFQRESLAHMRSSRLIKSKGVHKVGRQFDMDIYEETFGGEHPEIANYRPNTVRYYVYRDMNGYQVVVKDPGRWARKYGIYRPLNDHVEIAAFIDKKVYHPSQFKVMDRKILAFVQTFQVTGS